MDNIKYKLYSRGLLLAGFDKWINAKDFAKQCHEFGFRVLLTYRYLDRLTWIEEHVNVWEL